MFDSIFQAPGTLEYVITHVFCPLKLPDKNDHTVVNDHHDFLAKVVFSAARTYTDLEHLTSAEKTQWRSITSMLDNLQASVESTNLDELLVASQLGWMKAGDVLAFLIRAKNAAVIFKKEEAHTIYESFEVSPSPDAVIAAQGKLLCSYSDATIQIPNDVFDAPMFQSELTNFLAHMNNDALVARDAAHPQHITELLTGILRAVGHPASTTPFNKRIGDDSITNNSEPPWRRSPLWLLIRVALQTSLDRSTSGRNSYKSFMVFFMSALAKEAILAELSSDLLHFMSSKLLRRLGKLGSLAPENIFRTVLCVCSDLRKTIEDRWEQVQASQCQSHIWPLPNPNRDEDTQLSLSNSREYIHLALADSDTNSCVTPFHPQHHCRGTLDDFLSSDGTFFDAAYRDAPLIALYDVERAVEGNIDAWIARVTDVDEASVRLETLADKYLSTGRMVYLDNPEQFSTMMLTGIELWLALDKIAVKKTPLLAEYSPEVPLTLLEHLLLCKSTNLHRLQRAYEYLAARHSGAHPGWSVFSAEITGDTFAVRYYHANPELQRLRALMEDDKLGSSFPLPLQHAVFVFERQSPKHFDTWRSVTFHLLGERLFDHPCHIPAATRVMLESCQQKMLDVTNRVIRVNKGFISLSIFTRNASAKSSNICVHYHPSSRSRGAINYSPLNQGEGYTSYQLPSGPYRNLQNYLNATSHSPNEVLASQAECHPDLPLQEFIAYGHLRSGSSLQWLNILRELRCRTLNFNSLEVHLLLAQATTQVGPFTLTGPEWHQSLEDSQFPTALLRELESLLRDIEANWREVVAMNTISFLLIRLLVSSHDLHVLGHAHRLLFDVRTATFHWVQELSAKFMSASTHEAQEDYRWLLVDAAAVCRSTFGFIGSNTIQDFPDAFRKFLIPSESINVLLFCAIMIHDAIPHDRQSAPPHSQLLLTRNDRLSQNLEDAVKDLMMDDPTDTGINRALCKAWPTYRPGTYWKPLASPNSRWLTCETKPFGKLRSQVVHFNFLDGTVLMNGKGLNTLASAISHHPVYSLIFGKNTFSVLPSDLPGTEFSARNMIFGHQVYFSWRNGHLVIRATYQDSDLESMDTLELIPQDVLKSDLPTSLVEGHVHWLKLSAPYPLIEIRPLEKCWDPASVKWTIGCPSSCARGVVCCKYDNHEKLIDLRSPSWSAIANLFRMLDVPENLIITIPESSHPESSSSSPFSVTLPRYGLSFFVDKDGELRSNDFPDMVYDENQSTGTMFGLVNQLVLRPKHEVKELLPRRVIIPDGRISFKQHGHHIRVEIGIHHLPTRHITYHTYAIDTHLGCLTGNVGLTSKLFRVYLHALTGSVCTDPLTGRTGTEEALSLLQSAGCRSIWKLEPRDAELLCLIATLCSPRMFRVGQGGNNDAQTAGQLETPVHAQYAQLYLAAKAIKEHSERVQLFDEDQPTSGPLFAGFALYETHLLQRFALRTAYLHASMPSGVLGALAGPHPDMRYPPMKDGASEGLQERRAFAAASAIRHWSIGLETVKGLRSTLGAQSLTTSAPLPRPETISTLRFDKTWLDEKLPNDPLVWIANAYSLLRNRERAELQFQLLFTLPAMAYCSPELAVLARTVITFAIHPPGSAPTDPGLLDHTLMVKNHLTHLENTLRAGGPDTLLASSDPLLYPSIPFHNTSLHAKWSPITLDQLFSRRKPLSPSFQKLEPEKPPKPRADAQASSAPSRNFDPLHQLIANVQQSTDNLFQRQYAATLRASARHLGDSVDHTLRTSAIIDQSTLKSYYKQCEESFFHALDSLKEDLGPETEIENALARAGLWPCITADSLLRCLAPSSSIELPNHWKSPLISLACFALELQRARRLLRLQKDSLHEEFRRELETRCCDGWDPEVHTEWLLIQLQGNFFIRGIQVDIARTMISPQPQENTLVQLSMGEGKSSVIVPICAATLADGKRLLRVIVPKALTAQMFQTLVDRLGGYANRRIYHLPVSRSLKTNPAQVVALHELFSECMSERGILVAQPDDILSPMLTSIETELTRSSHVVGPAETGSRTIARDTIHILPLTSRPLSQRLHPAHPLLELQRWLHVHVRDILDECDEILSFRLQMVYTIGPQQDIEGCPDRWTIVQQVLKLVKRRASRFSELFPHSVEHDPAAAGSFPHFRVLHLDAARQLVAWVAEDVMDRLLPSFTSRHLHFGVVDAVHMFISRQDVPLTTARIVEESFRGSPLWNKLLLLRGLLANGILLFSLLERRWRVDYGPLPARTLLAVPYRAKDTPAPKAEFGHPDVTTILTCLSYYYSGLDEWQLRKTFEKLLELYDPAPDYALWIKDCPDSMPDSLRRVGGINVRSSEQWENYLVPLFSRNQATIDFYLSKLVFPREAKRFPWKISASGWDIAERRKEVITGFSGTKDGQYLLPISIVQHDVDHQRGSDAKVLAFLLRPENELYTLMAHRNGERWTTLDSLRAVAGLDGIRVLLDVGAQVLDLRNCELAQAWLDLRPDASAAIYFNESDELTVLTRHGSTQPLFSSSFNQQLDQCVIYLDHAHTRGTDLRFPIGFQAAVTLGLKITKDRLVQGCMRMRMLGNGHSVAFFAPIEVDRNIRSLTAKRESDIVNTTDILQWVLHETCNEIQRWAPLWVQQGIEHTTRYDAWSRFCRNELTSNRLSETWLQKETKSLEELYAPRDHKNPVFLYPEIRRHCVNLGLSSADDAGMNEEQEREVIYEVERIQIQERGYHSHTMPVTHSIHPEVAAFVKSGIIPERTKVFLPIFQTLPSRLANTVEAHVWSPYVLATKDFLKAVICSTEGVVNLRPVQWVISSKVPPNEVLVLLSPFEANTLMSEIRCSNKVHLHLYTPRTIKSMKPCDNLSLISIPEVPSDWSPPWHLIDQLNVFAGQLYFTDHSAYIRLARFLCIYTEDLRNDENIVPQSDGFIPPKKRQLLVQPRNTFQRSPLRALRTLIVLRMQGINITETHMGDILEGRVLTQSDFEIQDLVRG